MRGRTGAGALVLSALACATVGQAASSGEPASAAPAREHGPTSPLPDRTQQPAPPPVLPEAVVVRASASLGSPGWALGVTGGSTALDLLSSDLLGAYSLAVAAAPASCQISTSLLAAIGQVESGNLAGRRIDVAHRVRPAVVGPVLDGAPYAALRDTDGGRWDGDVTWDRAVGPMQLLPATWRVVGVDMDGDGVRDPQDVYDAAGAAMVYLCGAGRDLGTSAGLRGAVFSYNHSVAYLDAVLGWKAAFDRPPTGFASAAWLPPVTARARTQALVRQVSATGTGVRASQSSPDSPSVPSGPVLQGPLDPAALVVPPGSTPVVGPLAGPDTTTTLEPATAPTIAPTGAPTGPAADPVGPSSGPSPSNPSPSNPSPGTSGPSNPAAGTPGPSNPGPSNPGPSTSGPDPVTPVTGAQEPLPVCALPTSPSGAAGDPTPSPAPGATVGATSTQATVQTAGQTPASSSGSAPASGETCVPPVGYELDPVSGELVPVAPTTP